MRLATLVALSSLLAVGALNGTLEGRSAAQYAERSAAMHSQLEWENDLFRVRRIAIAPSTQMSAPETNDSILVYLNADLEGRLPAAEAVFQARGAQPLENRGSVRFDAISIALKDVPASQPGVTPPEAFPVAGATDVRVVIDNPRVTVVKARYKSNAYSGPLHFHPRDAVVVYLGGGYAWPTGGTWGSYRVARGDVDLIPANTLHAFGNAGSDPLDVLVIVPK